MWYPEWGRAYWYGIVLLDDFGPCMYHNIIMIIHIILATLDVLRIYLAQEVKWEVILQFGMTWRV